MKQLRMRVSNLGGPVAAVLVLCLAVGAAGCGSSKKKEPSPEKPTAGKNRSSRVPKADNAPTATKPAKGAEVLKALAPVKRPGGEGPSKQIAGITGLPTDRAVEALSNDVGKFWQDAFNGSEYRFEPATQNIVTTSVDSACGTLSTDDPPTFCADDDSLNWTIGWFDKEAAPLGSFPIGWVVAVMWGYHIEAQLGLRDKLSQGEQATMASCLAGIWTSSIYKRGALEEGDIEQGAKLVAHLNPSEEDFKAIAGAFDKGFNSGEGGQC